METKKAIRYLRFSHDGQSNSSIEWQDTYTAQYCSTQKLEIIDTFIDAGYSAKTFDRPDFDKLSKFIAEHYRQVDYLIVNQMDRFSRDAGEALTLVKKLQKKYSIQIVSVTEGITFDYQTPGSFFRTGLQLLLAEDDNINRTQKINSGVYTAKAREGRFIGSHAPFGYIKEGIRKEKTIVPFAEHAQVIRYIFNSYLSNTPLWTIYKNARAMGLKALGNSVIHKILSNPIYSGQQLVKPWKGLPGGLFPAKFEPLIDMQTWLQVQHKLKIPTRPGISLHDKVPLRGVLHCHCGRLLTAAPSKNKLGNYYYYYKCNTTSTHNNISATKAHDQMQQIMQHLSIPEYIIDTIRERTERDVKEQLKNRKEVFSEVKNKLIDCERDIVSLEEKYIKDKINFETYNRWFADTANNRSYLKKQLEILSKGEEEIHLSIYEHLYLLRDLQFIYNRISVEDKQELVRRVFDNRLYYHQNIYRTPYLMEIFHHNILKLKELKLLELDEKREFLTKLPTGGGMGSVIEHPIPDLISFLHRVA